MTEADKIKWYVLRCHGMSAPKICATLDAFGIEWYQPFSEEVVKVGSRRVKRRVCMMKDFVFVHTSRRPIQELIDTGRIQAWFYYDLCHRLHHEPVTVSDKEMEDFIRVAEAHDRKPEIRRFEDLNLAVGTRIRILNGPFQDVEGDYVQLKRGAKKELVVRMSNFLTVSVKLTDEEIIEVVDETKI